MTIKKTETAPVSSETQTHPVSVYDLFDIAGTLSSTLDLDCLLRKIGLAAEKLLQAEASSIMLLDESEKFLYFKTATGEKAHEVRKMTVPVGTGLAGWVAQHYKPLLINDVSCDPRFSSQFDKTSGFTTRSVICIPMLLESKLIGVVEVLNKKGEFGFTEVDLGLLSSLAGLAAVAITNAKLAQDQKNFFSHVLEILTMAVESTHPGMQSHPVRSAELACSIGRFMGVEDSAYKDLYYAALLHDLGYLGIRNPRLLAQFGLMPVEPLENLHPVLSAYLLSGIRILRNAIPMIRHHHENFDGSGYPDKLAGDAIPFGARILGLVEAVEEIRMHGLSGEVLKKQAVMESKNGAGSRFDSKIVRAFVDWVPQGDFRW